MTFDKEADAAYIYLSEINPGEVKRTIPLNEDIAVDFDQANRIIGIEILNAARNLPQKYLKKAELLENYNSEKGLKSIWLKNRMIFFIDEAEFVVLTSLFALIDRLDLALWILAVSQVLIAFWRSFERGYQLHTNSKNLLKPMRK